MRDILFEIFSKTEIRERFDKIKEFWRRVNVHSPNEQKLLGLYEVEHIDNPCYVTLAANPKEYFEYFKSNLTNKKHKGIEKDIAGMEHEHYAESIKLLFNFKYLQKTKCGR